MNKGVLIIGLPSLQSSEIAKILYESGVYFGDNVTNEFCDRDGMLELMRGADYFKNKINYEPVKVYLSQLTSQEFWGLKDYNAWLLFDILDYFIENQEIYVIKTKASLDDVLSQIEKNKKEPNEDMSVEIEMVTDMFHAINNWKNDYPTLEIENVDENTIKEFCKVDDKKKFIKRNTMKLRNSCCKKNYLP